jgi:amino acid adenylation domain-containing protein
MAGNNTFPTARHDHLTRRPANWFEREVVLHELRLGAGAYNTAVLHKLDDTVDATRVLQAFSKVASRQESLGYRVELSDGNVWIEVGHPPSVDTGILQLGPECDVAAGEGIAAVVVEPFDWSTGPLLRVRVVMQPMQSWLVIVGTQLVLDGTALALARKAIELAYVDDLQATGQPIRRYKARDVAEHRLQAANRYWSDMLSGTGGISRLPHATPSRGLHDHGRWVVPVVAAVQSDVRTALRTTASRLGVPGSTPYLFAFGRAVAAWTSRPEAVIGYAADARSNCDEDECWGSFVNTLLIHIRTDLETDEALATLGMHLLDALEWRDLPVRPAESAGRHSGGDAAPDFYLVYNAGQFVPLQLGPARCPRELLRIAPALHPITVDVFDDTDVMQVVCSYSPTVLTRERADAFLALFFRELESLASGLHGGGARDLIGVPMATPAGPGTGTYVSLFDRQVALHPDRTAVIGPSVPPGTPHPSMPAQWTMARLARQSHAVAAQLAALNLARGAVVGLCMERSGLLIGSMVGVMRATCAFVSIDPALAAAEPRDLQETLGLQAVITDLPGRSAWNAATCRYPSLAAVEVLDATKAAQAAAPALERPTPALYPQDRAYVVLSSGTTGRPKASINHHRGLVNHILGEERLLRGFGRGCTVLQSAAVTFDIHVWQCLGPLLVGGQVVIAPDATDLDAIARQIRHHGVTLVEGIPTHLEALARVMGDCRDQSARMSLMLTGEAAHRGVLASLAAAFPNAEVVNAWGPSEAADDVLQWSSSLAGDAPACAWASDQDILPLGSPLPGTAVIVVDEQLRELPHGCVGELAVVGVAVGDGYLGQPRLTARRFRPQPRPGHPGARMYLTGDAGYRDARGTVYFVGRMDHRIKVSGGWVDMELVEAATLAMPGVQEAAVVPIDTPTGTRLVGFAALDADHANAADGATLRRQLALTLPARSVPYLLFTIPAIPRTANGKTDRKALLPLATQALDSAQSRNRLPLGHAYANPALRVLTEILGYQPTSLHVSLSDAGARSIDVLRLSAALNKELGISCSVAELYRCGTLQDVINLAHASLQASVPPIAICAFPVPASPLQRGMWATCQLLGSDAFLLPVGIRLSNCLRPDRIEHAARRLLEHCWVLRSRVFETDEGVWLEPVAPAPDWLERVYWDGPMDPETLSALTARPLDLKAGRSSRAVLVIALDHRSAVLVINVHHIVFDGRSSDLLVRAFEDAYARFGGDAGLHVGIDAAASLNAFDHFLHAHQAPGPTRQARSYWAQRLLDAPRLSTLPPRRLGSGGRSHEGRQFMLAVDDDVRSAFDALASRHFTSVFAVGLAVHALCLARTAAQDDVCVGLSTENRLPAYRDALGYFSNTIPFRVVYDPLESFSRYLGRVSAALQQDLAHSDLEFADILEAARIPYTESDFPLVQTEFNFVTQPAQVLAKEGVLIESIAIPGQGAKLDLTISLHDESSGCCMLVEYSSRRLDRSDAQSYCESLLAIVAAAARAPEVPVGLLPMLSPRRKAEVLAMTAPASHFSLPDQPLHELVAKQILSTPDAVALRCGEEHWTYERLGIEAGRIRDRLMSSGVGPGMLVGVCTKRGLGYAACALGVMQSGAAFCPLEPEYGRIQIARMCAAVGLRHVLTDPPTRALLEGAVPAEGVLTWNDAPMPTRQSPGAPPLVRAQDPIYCMFTSGSTGVPKGAIVHHNGAVNHIYSKLESLGLWEEFNFLQNAPVSSDISFWQYFGPLLMGGMVVIQKDNRDLEETARLMVEQPLTLVEMVPMVAQTFLDLLAAQPGLHAQVRERSTVRYLMFTGDRLLPGLVQDWYGAFPGIQAVNAFGPTEASDDVIQGLISPEHVKDSVIGLGHVLPNIEVRIFSPLFELQPPGAVGEVCVSGVAVGGGYWNNPRRTAAAFVPDPYSRVPGARMYRVGDVGHMNPEGWFYFHGRNDHQIKVNGTRLELGAIEAAARAHEEVASAACVAYQQTSTTTALVLFYVPASGADRTTLQERLTAHLEESLPLAAVPTLLLSLPALPLTSNEKVDRKALLALARQHQHAEQTASRPVSALESKLLEVAAEVLQTAEIDPGTPLSTLGLNSLSAARVASRIRLRFGVDVTLRDVLRARTIGRLASFLSTRSIAPQALEPKAAVGQPAEPTRNHCAPVGVVATTASPNPYQMSFLLPDLLEGSLSSDRYTTGFALLVRGDLDPRSTATSIHAAMTGRHPWLSAALGESAEGDACFVLDAAPMPLTMHACSDDPRHAVIASIESFFDLPFDLTGAPLARLALFTFKDGSFALVFCAYHAVLDGWGVARLRRETVEDLRALRAGLTLSGQRRSHILPAESEPEVPPDLIAYWRELLASGSMAASFLRDRFEDGAGRVLTASATLPKDVTERIRQGAESEGLTLFCVLLAAVALALQQETGVVHPCIGVAFANRLSGQDESDLACRVNTVPLVLDVSAPGLHRVAEQVSQQLLADHGALAVPLSVIQSLAPQDSRSREGLLFETLVTMNNISAPSALDRLLTSGTHASALEVSEYQAHNRRPVYPCMFDLVEASDGSLTLIFEGDSRRYSAERGRSIVERLAAALLDADVQSPHRLSLIPQPIRAPHVQQLDS